MKIHRIYSIVLRFLYGFKYSLERLTDAFYWPVIELFTWGLTSHYIQSMFPNTSKVILIFLSGLMLNLILWRGQYEITINLLNDIWNRNMINIFGAPLKFSEWISAFVILSIMKAFITFAFASVVAFFLYQYKILIFGYYLIPFILLLLMTSWWLGFLISSLIFIIGRRVEAFAWTLGALIAPFSAVFYPISVLPPWAQQIARYIPTSYVFEGARKVVATGKLDLRDLYFSFILNAIYLVLSIILLKLSFKKVLNRGLVKIF